MDSHQAVTPAPRLARIQRLSGQLVSLVGFQLSLPVLKLGDRIEGSGNLYHQIAGVVENVNLREFKLKVSTGVLSRSVELQVDRNADIYCDNQWISLKDLMIGDQVSVVYRKRSRRTVKLAESITVEFREGEIFPVVNKHRFKWP